MKKLTKSFELTSAEIGFIKTLDFERDAPGTILQDFEALLNLLGEKGITLSPSQLFALDQLGIINRNMTYPVQLNIKRPVQKSYPNINGLYLLLRATGIATIGIQGKKPFLKLEPTVMESWRSLNPAERYFELLRIWWERANDAVLGDSSSQNFIGIAYLFLEHLLEKEILIYQKPQDAESLKYTLGYHHAALLNLFGFIEIRPMPLESSKGGWLPAEIRLTKWGRVLMGSFLRCWKSSLPDLDVFSLTLFRITEGSSISLQSFDQWSMEIKPHIPVWRRTLKLPGLAFKSGVHVFKVSLGKSCWRRIAVPGKSFFAAFADSILNAFGFDGDHLYQFSYKDPFGNLVEINHPNMRESGNDYADNLKIGEAPLSPGMNIGFLYDFGDNWQFDIEVESVDAKLAIRKPKEMEKYGDAPEQYGDGEYEED